MPTGTPRPNARVIPFPATVATRAHNSSLRRHRRAPAENLLFRGGLRPVAEQLPEFGRRQFGVDLSPLGTLAPAHPHLQAIINESTGLPVGVVSPDYALIQHADVLHAAAEGIARLGIPIAACETLVELSPQGEHMLARITVPALARALPADGHPLLPCVMLSNSVDGKSALRAHLGWFRLVCMNGLVVPHATRRISRRHVGGLSFGEIADTVARELTRGESMRRALENLATSTLTFEDLAEWCDDTLRQHWGALTALRVFHIASRGMDVVAADPFETAAPSARRVEDFAAVPGARAFEPRAGGGFGVDGALAGTRHDALQALTWVASRSANLQQRWEREAQALALLARLPA